MPHCLPRTRVTAAVVGTFGMTWYLARMSAGIDGKRIGWVTTTLRYTEARLSMKQDIHRHPTAAAMIGRA